AGHWDIGLYGNLFGTREYQVWVPAGYDAAQPLPLLLVLHGCVTGPNLMGEASGFNDVADTEGFIVVYPRQNVTSNPARCWNWQLPINQARDSGEPSLLAGIVDKVKAGYSVDPHRVYVTGISAGGAMTSIMLACYSDVFAAGAGSIYSPDSNGRLAWQCSGSPSPRPLPVLVFHGSADLTVNPVNGQQAVRQFLQTNDLADDGLDNDSVKYVPTSTYHGQVPGGRAYTVDTYAYGGRTLVQHYVVQGMGHAWSGSQSGLPFTDPKGPDATLITWLFLKDYQR
ncbi:MAG: PHB depolymerase family esterase, partial [Stenotrophomonas sp.]|nr:PHB depolymerase family esterase [Stenotrophomonas sp.]